MRTTNLSGLAITSTVLVLSVAACQTTAPAGTGTTGTPCMSSGDCTTANGVCRNMMCAPQPCGASNPCMAGEDCVDGMCAPTKGTPCKIDTDCPPGSGVCRDLLCKKVPCGPTMPCPGEELCLMNSCAPATKASTSSTLAAGGSVSTSAQHIHVGLTGQGRAV